MQCTDSLHRVLGVGRNEYIQIINEYRTKGWIAKQRRRTARALLPAQPCCGEIQPWWVIHAVQVDQDELALLPEPLIAAMQVVSAVSSPSRCVLALAFSGLIAALEGLHSE